MNNVDTRPPFFPNTRTGHTKIDRPQTMTLQRNSADRVEELQAKTGEHVKVDIGNKIRDFSRIKKAVDTAPEIDNSAKIADLKARINAGTYEVNYDALADKLLESEF